MTSVLARGTPAARYTRRRGIVYAINVVHPDTGRVMVGYVGQTRQALKERETQHRETQPWADTIVGHAYVLDSGWWTDEELDARETWHIRRWLPLYNIEQNMGNPWRIPPWSAVEQRRAREPGWKPPRGKWIPVWRPSRRAPRHVVTRRIRWAAHLGVWVALTVVSWWAAGWTDLPYAAGVATLGMAAWKVWRRTQRRPRRR